MYYGVNGKTFILSDSEFFHNKDLKILGLSNDQTNPNNKGFGSKTLMTERQSTVLL
jgi:hypothetical protein